jgi:hypothetical protein
MWRRWPTCRRGSTKKPKKVIEDADTDGGVNEGSDMRCLLTRSSSPLTPPMKDGRSRRIATLPEEICKETIAEWNDATGDYVRDKMFAKMQFVTDADLVTGGKVEFLVTKELHHINGEERKRLFWEVHGGRATVRNTIRKKADGAECHEASMIQR